MFLTIWQPVLLLMLWCEQSLHTIHISFQWMKTLMRAFKDTFTLSSRLNYILSLVLTQSAHSKTCYIDGCRRITFQTPWVILQVKLNWTGNRIFLLGYWKFTSDLIEQMIRVAWITNICTNTLTGWTFYFVSIHVWNWLIQLNW